MPSTCKVDYQITPVTLFRLNALKGTTKAPFVDLLRLNTQLTDTKTVFLTLKLKEGRTYRGFSGTVHDW